MCVTKLQQKDNRKNAGDVMTGRMAVVIAAMIISGSVVFAMSEKKRYNR